MFSGIVPGIRFFVRAYTDRTDAASAGCARVCVCVVQEQISQEAYNEKSDIWSVGCLIYELAALVPPFEAANQVALALKIKEGRVRRLPSQYSEELNRCIGHMLKVEVRSSCPSARVACGAVVLAVEAMYRREFRPVLTPPFLVGWLLVGGMSSKHCGRRWMICCACRKSKPF